MIQITPSLAIDEAEIHEEFIRASGSGGQNVNKVSTAVQIRFDVQRSPSLPDAVRERLLRLAANRITDEGVLVITARGERTQAQNRIDAQDQLIDLIRRAVKPPTPRYVTRPTFASKVRRQDSKRRRSQIKQGRRTSFSDE